MEQNRVVTAQRGEGGTNKWNALERNEESKNSIDLSRVKGMIG